HLAIREPVHWAGLQADMQKRRILVTGATGYVGGRLVPLLLQKGYAVRCMARDPRKLAGRWDAAVTTEGQLEIVPGDVLKPETLAPALQGVEVAYYLMHAMGDGEKGFVEREKQSAAEFAHIAARQGVRRIIYLGGLGRRDIETSAHLHSRHQTGDLLRTGSVPVTELRAAVVVGSGSVAFEMLRHLTEKLPLMVCPRWIETRTQPIYINDTLAYLIAALETAETEGRILDIGGPDVLSYREMMLTYAGIKSLRRLILTVPVLTPRLSAYWVNLVTPIPASIAFPLIEGLKTETVCENDEARRLMPIPLTSFRDALKRTIRATDELKVPTRWTGAQQGAVPQVFDPATIPAHGLLQDQRVVNTAAPTEALHRAISRIGGAVGWYYADWLWVIRGALDRALGGVGLRRGRRHPEQVAVGDAIDFWRVEEYAPERMRLHAEMKLPGRAWLEFQIRENSDGSRALIQTAYYAPRSFWGMLYWYLLIPVHFFVFRGMARGLVRWAEQHQTQTIRGSQSQPSSEISTILPR
ncbi:MAG TPA: SDR family oxidoreductase, partial [Chthonomonadaceae bacterium]|nr:SDR family oxidoreductase [Chthonomonadaceae bacterium]